MSLAHPLFLAAACVSFLAASTIPPVPRNLLQLHNMIKCAIPGSNPLMEYADYGCYCGFGGSGTPIDDVDKCCQIHDDCYSQSKEYPTCRFLVDNPYTKTYSYSCSGGNITCTDDKDECAAFICNCDRAVAICFAGTPYNEEYKNLDTSKYCK